MTGTCPVSKTCTALLPFQASAAKHAVLIYSSCASICSVITFANRSDFISFRHHTYLMPKGAKSVELTEVCAVTHAAPEQILVTELEGAASDCGPRFELKLFQIKLGTMDQQDPLFHSLGPWDPVQVQEVCSTIFGLLSMGTCPPFLLTLLETSKAPALHLVAIEYDASACFLVPCITSACMFQWHFAAKELTWRTSGSCAAIRVPQRSSDWQIQKRMARSSFWTLGPRNLALRSTDPKAAASLDLKLVSGDLVAEILCVYCLRVTDEGLAPTHLLCWTPFALRALLILFSSGL
eukprot:677428-Pelagomonas_calceolata.AAC.3